MADNMKLVTKEYVDTGLTSKVDKEEGKGLSTNDFTNEDKEKLYSALQNENIDQTYSPTSANAQSGKAVAEAISPMRQTIIIDTPVWKTQPTIAGTLNESFKTWESSSYYMTLKNTDGTALESGQFKLCTTLNGYASAIEQIFTFNSSDITENKPVDFKTISSDRTSFEMRDAGIKSFVLRPKNIKSQRYIFSVFQSTIPKGTGMKYVYLSDSIGISLTNNADYYSPIGAYKGQNGFLFTIGNSSIKAPFKLGYQIYVNRTKIGLNVSLIGLTSERNAISQYCFSNCTKGTNDVTQENISYFTIGGGASNTEICFGNGTTVTLEEFA